MVKELTEDIDDDSKDFNLKDEEAESRSNRNLKQI